MSRPDRPEVELRCPDKTKAAKYVGTAMRARLDDLRLLLLLSEGGRELDRTQMLDVLGLEGPADEGEIVDAANERLVELPLCVQTTTIFEIVLGTGGPDDRLIVECDTERVGGMGNSALVTYSIRRILYRYTWSGSGEVELIDEDSDTAEAFARQVVSELVE
jgi:hypothetical protein